MQDNLQTNKIDNSGLTAKYLKDKKEALKKISNELVELITKQVKEDKTVDVMRDDWNEKYKKLEKENIG